MRIVSQQRRQSLRSDVDDLTFACRNRAGPRIVRIGGEDIHEIVIVRRIVMKET